MDNRPMVLKKWSTSVRMEQESHTSIPIWVKFSNLPLHFWTKECLAKMESLVGVPLFMDTATQLATKISCVWVCVEVSANSVLPDSVVIESKADGREVFSIIYDWKPHACSHCHTFGHDDVLCFKRPRSISPAPKQYTLNGFSTGEKGGPSLSAKFGVSLIGGIRFGTLLGPRSAN
ncbi:hypothetical protein QJS10_CPB20g00636 [Acorus calamus]|uniref:DUF4283 domain-containing protein n=1 Tax=Acorus calamus TaxID=4465 RepID=A0AAV9CC80_ACOCL|nr:hypothetical protein QJS10_CPB20g00636 [Acorus calamus]